jgi:hypothetical protein
MAALQRWSAIVLEELGMEYEVTPVNIGAGDQFKPEFLKITPNHCIPAIADELSCRQSASRGQQRHEHSSAAYFECFAG